MCKIILPIAPVSWCAHGGYGKRSYNKRSKEKAMYVDMIQTAWKTESIYGAVRLSFIFNMPIPKSYSEKKRQSLIGKYHTKRPDTSNLIKFTEDCLKGMYY